MKRLLLFVALIMTSVLGVGSQAAQASDCAVRTSPAPWKMWWWPTNVWILNNGGDVTGCDPGISEAQASHQLQWYNVNNGTWVTVVDTGLEAFIPGNGWSTGNVYACGYTPASYNATWRNRIFLKTKIVGLPTWRYYAQAGPQATVKLDTAIWCGP